MPQSNKTTALRAAPARGVMGKVDREKGIIHGIAVVTMGEALGHGVSLDEEFIDATVKNGKAMKNGLKSRFGHPNMSSSAVGTLLGRVKNFTKDTSSGVPIARGDLHLSQSAKTSPNGDLFTHVLDLAEHDPDQFGTSIVFKAGKTYKRGDEGEKVFSEDKGFDEIPGDLFVEQEELRADDVVDEPAANDGLFSAFSADQPAAIVTQFLDENPEVFKLLNNDNIEEIFSAFKERYTAYKTNSYTEPANPTKEPETMADTPNTDQGRENAVAELSSLKEALPLEFAVAAFEAGQNVQEAKAAYCDVLKEQLSASVAKVAELETQLSEVPPVELEPAEGAKPVEFNEAHLQPSEDADESAATKFAAFKKESGLDHNAAVAAFAKKHPELIDELNK